MKPHEQRVVAEKAELDVKRDALKVFLDGDVFKTLPHEDKALLQEQGYYMHLYSQALGVRISRFPADPPPAESAPGET